MIHKILLSVFIATFINYAQPAFAADPCEMGKTCWGSTLETATGTTTIEAQAVGIWHESPATACDVEKAYVWVDDTTGRGFKIFIYASSGDGMPGALLATSDEGTLDGAGVSGGAWQPADFSTPFTPATSTPYYVVVATSGGAGAAILRNAAGTKTMVIDTITYPTATDPFAVDSSVANRDLGTRLQCADAPAAGGNPSNLMLLGVK